MTIAFGFEGSGLAGDQPRISFDVTTVPEPEEWAMLLVGGIVTSLASSSASEANDRRSDFGLTSQIAKRAASR